MNKSQEMLARNIQRTLRCPRVHDLQPMRVSDVDTTHTGRLGQSHWRQLETINLIKTCGIFEFNVNIGLYGVSAANIVDCIYGLDHYF
jgi:hypothetical protein